MLKILSIGNSFSQDAQRYLHQIAKHDNFELYCENLYIGGCSLQTHCENIKGDLANYELEINGKSTGRLVSIKQALLEREWDFITLQQVSTSSGHFETYLPYADELSEYVKKHCRTAKLLVHQTWAYEEGSELLTDLAGYETSHEMLKAITEAYSKFYKRINASGLIPSGQAMMRAIDLGLKKAHRDTFHASFGAGRYLLGLTWYKYLSGKDITNNTFDAFDEPVLEAERKIVIEAVNAVIV